MLPRFSKISTITFPMHRNANTHYYHQPCDIILGIDAIAELGIIIYGQNKSIKWEDNTIPIRTVQGSSPTNNEVTFGKPLFATI